MDAPPLEMSKARLGGSLRNLVQWKLSHPLAGGWIEVRFKIPSNPNNYMISCNFIFLVFASLGWTRRSPAPGEVAGGDPHSVGVLPAHPMFPITKQPHKYSFLLALGSDFCAEKPHWGNCLHIPALSCPEWGRNKEKNHSFPSPTGCVSLGKPKEGSPPN